MVGARQYILSIISFSIYNMILNIIIFFLKKYYNETNVIILIISSIVLFYCLIIEIFIVYSQTMISKFFYITAIIHTLSQIYIIYFLEKKYNTNIISYNLILLSISLILSIITLKNHQKYGYMYVCIDIICFILFVILFKFNILQIIFSFIYIFIFSFSSIAYLCNFLQKNEDTINNFVSYLMTLLFIYFGIFFIFIMIFKYNLRDENSGEDLYY